MRRWPLIREPNDKKDPDLLPKIRASGREKAGTTRSNGSEMKSFVCSGTERNPVQTALTSAPPKNLYPLGMSDCDHPWI